jgi:hypothetical protein
MAIDSAYYDTCVFQQSFNPAHQEHGSCKVLVDPTRIKWTVGFCAELSGAEATVSEYLTYFEIECVRNGVNLKPIRLSEAKKAAKPHLHLRKRLFAMGFSQNDWNHLTAALVEEVRFLCSVDPDFWDPANKAKRKAKKVETRAKKAIESSFALRVRLPSELCAMI